MRFGWRATLAVATFAVFYLIDIETTLDPGTNLLRQAEARRIKYNMNRFDDRNPFSNNNAVNNSSSNSSSNNNSSSSSSSNNNSSSSSKSTTKNDKNDKDDDDDDNKRSSNSGRSGGSNDKNSDSDTSQPSTLQEWLKQKPKPADSSKEAEPRKPRQKNDEPRNVLVPATPAPAAKAARALSIPSNRTENWNGNLNGKSYAQGELLGLKLSKKGEQQIKALGYGLVTIDSTGLARIRIPDGMDARDAEKFLKENLKGEKFSQNKLYRFFEMSNEQGLLAHGVVKAGTTERCSADRCQGRILLGWDEKELSACTDNIKVGVIDTGVDPNHPALTVLKRENIKNFHPNERTPAPNWHGTAVFGVLAGNARSATPGLLPRANFYVANTFFVDGRDEVATDTLALMQAFKWMEEQGVQIVNMSFAGPPDPVVEAEITRLSAKGMVFIAAVGNDGPTAEPGYPAAYKQVIAVTAVNKDRRVYTHANRGRHIDLSAPGVDIWTTVPGGREGYYTGTSFAAPYATALVATVYARTRDTQKDKLLQSMHYLDLGLPGRDSTYGRGLPMAPNTCEPAVLPPVAAQDWAPVPTPASTPSIVPAVAAPPMAVAAPPPPVTIKAWETTSTTVDPEPVRTRTQPSAKTR